MPYAKNVHIFREKGAEIFSKKVWEPLNFMKKMGQKNIVDLFLLSFNSKLSHFLKEPQFKSQMAFTNLEKTNTYTNM
jgi:hypothetical protein